MTRRKLNPRKFRWPTAHEVAQVIVLAAKHEGEDPIAVATGRPRSRARVYAFATLASVFDTLMFVDLMRLCGAPEEMAATMSISARQIVRGDPSKNSFWFVPEVVNKLRVAMGWGEASEDRIMLRRWDRRGNALVEDNS